MGNGAASHDNPVVKDEGAEALRQHKEDQAMSRLGGDIPAMERLHGQLRQKSQQVQSLRSELTNLVGQTYWEGPAANRFRSEWNGQYSQSLQRLEQLLNDLGVEVQRRKDALVQVSA